MYTKTYKEILYKNIFTYRVQLKFSNIKNNDKIILYKIDSMESKFYVFFAVVKVMMISTSSVNFFFLIYAINKVMKLTPSYFPYLL